jgi:imidazolonepropionase-like amidohydrolase
MKRLILVLAAALVLAPSLQAQGLDDLTDQVRERYVAVGAADIVIQNVTVVDGTGGAVLRGQSVHIHDGRIAAIGNRVSVPTDAEVVDGTGKTLIPGMFGLHDHMYYTAAGGRSAQLSFTGPRLYLGAGVTTIRTTGSRAPYSELNLKAEIDRGTQIGPRIHITAPYITGGQGATSMTLINSPEQARRFVAYWAEEGVTWLKAYTNISREDLGAAIDEAHRRGVKVTGHICSVSFTEAVEMGIDNLEHGLLTNTDYHPDKELDACPPNNMVVAGNVDPGSPEVAETFRKMIDAGVGMTSTLVVYELFFQNRPTKDARTLEAMTPEVQESYLRDRERIDEAPVYPLEAHMLRNAMAYEKAFADAGGVLASGVDPTGNGGALPGYGDQRNYELLIEAGFTTEEAVEVVSLNGARILGEDEWLGSIEVGKTADLVLLEGDLTSDASVIRNTMIVFKEGVGFDSLKMLSEVKGQVGIR